MLLSELFDKETYWNRRNNTVKVKVPDGDNKKKDGTPKMKTVLAAKPLRGQVEKEPKVKVYKDENGKTYEGKGQSFGGRILAMNRKFFRDNKKTKNRLMTKKGYNKGQPMNKEKK